MAKKELKYSFEITGDIGYGFGSKSYVAQKLKEKEGQHCDVRVNSLGGSVDDALDIVARMQEHGDVTCYMKGMNASAATILAMGAKKICMDKNGLMLIHNCLDVVWELGWMNANEIQEAMDRMKKQAEDQQTVDRVIATIYSNRSGKTFEQIKEVMDRGGWLSAQECLELGLIDEIIETTAEERKCAAVARSSFSELQLAYGLPSLPDVTIADTIQNTIDTINTSMKTFFAAILALFNIEAIAGDATEEQVQDAIKSVTDQVNGLKDQLDKSKNEIDELKANHEKDVKDAEDAVRAEMQKTIDDLNAQVAALQNAPAAHPQEPHAGHEPVASHDLFEGKSAREIYDMI